MGSARSRVAAAPQREATSDDPDQLSEAVRGNLVRVGAKENDLDPDNPPLCNVFISQIDPGHTTTLLPLLSHELPLTEELAHLKRVRKLASADVPRGFRLEVVLAGEQEWQTRPPHLDSLLQQFNLSPSPIRVPAIAPPSRELLNAWKTRWPLVYRPGREQYIAPTPSQLRHMYSHLRRVADFARHNPREHHPVAAMLVHPSSNAVVAFAVDRSHRNERHEELPVQACLQHAVMDMLSQFAEPHGKPNAKRRRVSNVTIVAPVTGNSDIHLDTSTLRMDQYLCTDLDCYVSREPCVMCAMALVHSRIRRVIFAESNQAEVGGFFEAGIHAERRLNHRYEAFHLPIEEINKTLNSKPC